MTKRRAHVLSNNFEERHTSQPADMRNESIKMVEQDLEQKVAASKLKSILRIAI